MSEISKWWIIPVCLLIIGLTITISSYNLKYMKLNLSMDNNTLEAFNKAVELQTKLNNSESIDDSKIIYGQPMSEEERKNFIPDCSFDCSSGLCLTTKGNCTSIMG